MKKTNQRLITLVATTLLVSGAAFAAEPPGATSADSASAPVKHAVKPHNHMRDAKGVGMGDKQGASAGATKDESGKSDEAGKQESHEKKGVKPHNHPRDAKAA